MCVTTLFYRISISAFFKPGLDVRTTAGDALPEIMYHYSSVKTLIVSFAIP